MGEGKAGCACALSWGYFVLASVAKQPWELPYKMLVYQNDSYESVHGISVTFNGIRISIVADHSGNNRGNSISFWSYCVRNNLNKKSPMG